MLTPVTLFGGEPIHLLNGLVGYWKKDNAAFGPWTDSTAGAHNLTGTGFIGAPATNAGGKILTCALYDWNNSQYARYAGALGTLDIRGVGAWTIQVWGYRTAAHASGGGMFAIDGAGANQNQGPIHINGQNPITLDVRQLDQTWVNLPTATAPIANGQWFHTLAWYDPTQTKVYLQVNNGTVDEAAFVGGTDTTHGAVVLFGADVDSVSGAGTWWDGRLDEIGVWNRALNASERKKLYNTGSAWAFGNFTA